MATTGFVCVVAVDVITGGAVGRGSPVLPDGAEGSSVFNGGKTLVTGAACGW